MEKSLFESNQMPSHNLSLLSFRALKFYDLEEITLSFKFI